MKKTVLLSAIASTMIMAGGDIAPVEQVAEPAAKTQEADYGEIFGQLRGFYIDRTYNNNHPIGNRNSLNVGGYVGYTTPDLSGLKLTVAAYGTYGFEIHDDDAEATNGGNPYDPSLYGRDGENYAFIGQAYLDYTKENTNVKVGRMRLDTPMAGADDARMLPNLFEAAVITNSDIENTTLLAGHVTKMTMGTFSNIYDNSASLGLYSGYGLGTTLAQSGDFEDMGDVALGAGTDTDGVTTAALIFKDDNGVAFQAWDYYAHDILNAIYLQADFGWDCKLNDAVKMKASAQYINEQAVGDELASSLVDIDANYWGAKLSASAGNLALSAAYSQTGDQGILSPWGGMPAFTQGMVTRHQFLADTDAWKVAASYKFAELNLKATAYYASFDVGTDATYAPGAESTEAGFDLIYQAREDLQLRFRGNFPRDFTGIDGTGWDEYRVIVNYNF